MESWTPRVRCIGCRAERPGTLEPCPHCGSQPYRHRTATPEEFQQQLEWAFGRDPLAPPPATS